MATQLKRERSSRVSRLSGLSIALTATLTFGLLAAVPAQADPVAPPATADEVAAPTTSDEAEVLWKAKEHEAALAGELLSEATQQSEAAAAALLASADAVKAADAAATTAGQQAAAADLAAAAAARRATEYQLAMDEFANASFTGTGSSMSALLTADSAEDFLDKSSAIEQVAADSRVTMSKALAARQAAVDTEAAAAAAAAAAATAAADAEAAKVAADKVAADAEAAKVAAEAKKTEMDAKVAEYQTIYNQLSEQERAAAAAEAERQRAESARLAAAAAAAAPAADAVAPAADGAAPAAAAAPAAPAPVAGSGGTAAGQAAVAAALSKVGNSYVFGASGPNSFDCSGLTSWAWKQAGVSIPRTSRGQAGLTSVPMDQLQPGDLITYYSPVSHVAMYIGNGQIVHASSPRTGVLIASVARGGPNASAHRVNA